MIDLHESVCELFLEAQELVVQGLVRRDIRRLKRTWQRRHLGFNTRRHDDARPASTYYRPGHESDAVETAVAAVQKCRRMPLHISRDMCARARDAINDLFVRAPACAIDEAVDKAVADFVFALFSYNRNGAHCARERVHGAWAACLLRSQHKSAQVAPISVFKQNRPERVSVPLDPEPSAGPDGLCLVSYSHGKAVRSKPLTSLDAYLRRDT